MLGNRVFNLQLHRIDTQHLVKFTHTIAQDIPVLPVPAS
jgi:hypothetical protein